MELDKLKLPGKVTRYRVINDKRNKDNVKEVVTIPKIIFQTWKSRDDIPDKWISGQESIETYMSDWTHVITDDDDNRNFIKEYYPEYLSKYDSFPYNIQRADFVRPFLLYKFGGLYLDMDIEIQRPLDDLFTSDSEVFLVMSGNVTSCTTNSFMASKKGAEFWKIYFEEMCQELPFWCKFTKHFTIMKSTGPIAIHRAFQKHESSRSIVILPAKLVMPCNICNMTTTCDTSESYIKPLQGSSWVTSWDTHFFNFTICCMYEIIFAVVVILILIIMLILLNILDKKRRR